MFSFPCISTRCPVACSCSTIHSVLLLAPQSSGPFSFQFLSLKHSTCLLLKFSEAAAERCSDLRQNMQSGICVYAKFCKTMPVCQIKKEPQDASIVWFWKKTVKNRYCALHYKVSQCKDQLKDSYPPITGPHSREQSSSLALISLMLFFVSHHAQRKEFHRT
jgi:hypothetical protein